MRIAAPKARKRYPVQLGSQLSDARPPCSDLRRQLYVDSPQNPEGQKSLPCEKGVAARPCGLHIGGDDVAAISSAPFSKLTTRESR